MSLREQFSPRLQALLARDEWLVAEDEYDPAQNLAYESRFCLANGYMGSRAVHEEGVVKNTLPACYVHGVFDRSEAFQRELCNTPDWAKLKIYQEREPLSPESGRIEGYLRVLDLKNGLVAKRYLHTDSSGRRTCVESVKLLSRAMPHCALLRVWLTPLNAGALFEIEDIVDATVTNFMDFPRFRVKHLQVEKVERLAAEGCYVETKTRDRGLPVGTGSFTRVLNEKGVPVQRSRAFRPYGQIACEFMDVSAERGETICIEKFSAVYTGRDEKPLKPALAQALAGLSLQGFEAALQAHVEKQAALWSLADVQLTGDEKMQKALRFDLFHLLGAASFTDNRVGIGAKLLHGEEYGGHSFWDTELFLHPFFDYVFPQVGRNLADYRYYLLDAARCNARRNGYQGAQFPWESADTGEEECPQWTIEPDGSCYRCHVAEYEHHVTAAVAYSAVQYYRITQDEDFWERQGLELLAETARFWDSRLQYDAADGTYHIRQVTGPDEWHEPVDDNAYTNRLAHWNLVTAAGYLAECQAARPEVYARLQQKICLKAEEPEEWKRRAAGLYLGAKQGLIEQFQGYFALADGEITQWDQNKMPLLPETLRPVPKQQRCILKQADVVMLLFLLGQEFDPETQRLNFDYYEKRTLHRSSLSPGVHCIMGIRTGESARAYEYLERSAYVDLDDNQGNTREGIHAAAAAITWQSVVLGYGGMGLGKDGLLEFAPQLPDRWEKLRFSIQYRGRVLQVCITQNELSLTQEGGGTPVAYRCNGTVRQAVLS